MYWFLKGFAFILSQLQARSIDRLAKILTFLSFNICRIRYSIVMKNLHIAFGNEKSEAEFKSIAKLSYYHLTLTALEFLRSRRISIAGNVSFVGREHIDAALNLGQGCYILCIHLGNWEAFGAAVSQAITPAHVVVKRVGSTSIDRFVCELRDYNKLFVFNRKKKGDAIRGIREILKKGEIVGFVMDQARSGEPRLPFFGKDATTNTALASLSRRFPAPIIPGFIRRVGVGQHVVEFLPALRFEASEDRERDVLQQTQEFNSVIEDMIRRYPEQYLWLHNRWK